MKNRILATALAVTLLIAGCNAGAQSSPAPEAPEKQEAAQENTQEAPAGGEEKKEEAAESAQQEDKAEEETKAASSGIPQLCRRTDYDWISTYTEEMDGDYQEYANLKIQYFTVYSEGFDALKNALKDDFKARKKATEWFENSVRESFAYSSEGDMYYPWPYEDTLELIRNDGNVVSYVSRCYSYMGGAHGGTTVNGVNLDTKTGEKLTLKGVVTDFEKFYNCAMTKLAENKDDYFEEWEETAKRDIHEEDAENGAFSWVLGDDFIRLEFGDYELAGYAMGHVTVDIGEDEFPGIIKSEYVDQSEPLCIMLNPHENYEVDVDGDGKTETLYVGYEEGYDEESGSVDSVKAGVSLVNGTDEMQSEKTPEDLEFDSAYFVRTKEGKPFVFIETGGYNDWDSLHIFDVSDPTKAPKYLETYGDGALYSFVPYDTGNMILETRADVMGTFSVYRHYTLNDNGKITPNDDEYTIMWFEDTIYEDEEDGVDEEGDDYKHMLVISDIQGYDSREKKNEVTIKKGENLLPKRTDGETYMVFENEKGEEVCVFYDGDRDEDSWERLINGRPESELFEVLRYAG